MSMDVITPPIGRMMKASDDDFTSRINALEGITALHDELQRVKHDVHQLRRLMVLSDGCDHIAKVLANHNFDRLTGADWGVEEVTTLSLGEKGALQKSPINPSATTTELSRRLAALNGGKLGLTGERGEVEKSTHVPVDQVPAEIWMHIFELCSTADRADWPDDAAGFNVPRMEKAPLILCRVCKYWRRLAMATPSLWTSCSLTLEKAPISILSLKSSMELWLRCSKSMDLAINLEVDPGMVHVFNEHLVDDLTRMLKRCQKLRVNVSDEVLYRVLRTGLPRLKTLEIRTPHLHREIESLDIRAPNLRTLDVLGPSMCRFSRNSLPWTQLKEYRGGWGDISRHLDIIRMSPNLERCTLHLFYESRVGGNVCPIRIEGLRHLRVVSCLGTTLVGFLSQVELPAIETLSLGISEESPAFSLTGWPKEHIIDLLERSNVRLKGLELAGMKVEEADLVEVHTRYYRLSGCNVVVQPL